MQLDKPKHLGEGRELQSRWGLSNLSNLYTFKWVV